MLTPEQLNDVEKRANAATRGDQTAAVMLALDVAQLLAEVKELGQQISAAHNDLRIAVGDGYSTLNSAAFEATRKIAALTLEQNRLNELVHTLTSRGQGDARIIAAAVAARAEAEADRDRARRWAVELEQQLAEIKRLAYEGGQNGEIVRRCIIAVFEDERRVLYDQAEEEL